MELSTINHDRHTNNSRKRKGRRSSDKVKVVYISSPVKVKTSASRFRALVQELTGQDSDVSRYMEVNYGGHDSSQQMIDLDDRGVSSVNNDRVSDSSTSSDSYNFEPSFEDLLMNSHGQGGFLGMSNLLSFDQGFEFDGHVVGGYGGM